MVLVAEEVVRLDQMEMVVMVLVAQVAQETILREVQEVCMAQTEEMVLNILLLALVVVRVVIAELKTLDSQVFMVQEEEVQTQAEQAVLVHKV
jgi:hypothetical protein